METLKNILKNYRKKAKLTQKQIAKKINISQCYYSAIETGRLNPSLKVFSQLAAILNIDMNILKPQLDHDKN